MGERWGRGRGVEGNPRPPPPCTPRSQGFGRSAVEEAPLSASLPGGAAPLSTLDSASSGPHFGFSRVASVNKAALLLTSLPPYLTLPLKSAPSPDLFSHHLSRSWSQGKGTWKEARWLAAVGLVFCSLLSPAGEEVALEESWTLP